MLPYADGELKDTTYSVGCSHLRHIFLYLPIVSILWVSNKVSAPILAAAQAASVPACPPPTTITSYRRSNIIFWCEKQTVRCPQSCQRSLQILDNIGYFPCWEDLTVEQNAVYDKRKQGSDFISCYFLIYFLYLLFPKKQTWKGWLMDKPALKSMFNHLQQMCVKFIHEILH